MHEVQGAARREPDSIEIIELVSALEDEFGRPVHDTVFAALLAAGRIPGISTISPQSTNEENSDGTDLGGVELEGVVAPSRKAIAVWFLRAEVDPPDDAA